MDKNHAQVISTPTIWGGSCSGERNTYVKWDSHERNSHRMCTLRLFCCCWPWCCLCDAVSLFWHAGLNLPSEEFGRCGNGSVLRFRAPALSQKRISCETSSNNGTSRSENEGVLQDFLKQLMLCWVMRYWVSFCYFFFLIEKCIFICIYIYIKYILLDLNLRNSEVRRDSWVLQLHGKEKQTHCAGAPVCTWPEVAAGVRHLPSLETQRDTLAMITHSILRVYITWSCNWRVNLKPRFKQQGDSQSHAQGKLEGTQEASPAKKSHGRKQRYEQASCVSNPRFPNLWRALWIGLGYACWGNIKQ